jgi:hypothetical protein
MAMQPLQFILYSRLFSIGDHRREKQYRCAQARERNAHLMQGGGVASAGRVMICGQILKVAARDDPKGGIAGHHWIKPRNSTAASPLRRFGERCSLTF